MYLYYRHGALDVLKAACDLIDRLMETVLKDLKIFLRNHPHSKDGAGDYFFPIFRLRGIVRGVLSHAREQEY